MPSIIVCPLNQVEARIAAHAPARMISLLDPVSMIETPAALCAQSHLKVGVNDIAAAQDGLVEPGRDHARAILDFVDEWQIDRPLLVHCWAGVSRSTATAFIAACRLNPDAEEIVIAQMIRRRSPTASPNPLLVAAADHLLGRAGRMRAAVEAIGRGEMAWEGVAFELPARLGARA
jgi:predicted protein tyrosine phosphatase